MAYDVLTDDALVHLVGCGDAAALAALYDRYARQALAVALLVTHEQSRATAVVEALFWECWRRGAPPLPGATVRNALMLSARRLAEQTFSPNTPHN